jgi:hypothetical protein
MDQRIEFVALARQDGTNRRARIAHRLDELLDVELHAQRDIAACAPDAGVALDEIADLFQPPPGRSPR